MCGRCTQTSDANTLTLTFDLDSNLSPALKDLTPRYNLAPSQPMAAIIADDTGRHLELLKWGLIPSWAKDPKIGSKMINARAETVAEKPAFRAALKKRRCLIPVDGFYEWKRDGKTKTPMYIQMKSGEPFALAGLYESWKPADSDKWIKSCTIITTTPNTLMENIHDRMPVIIKPSAYDHWLDPADTPAEKLLPLLKPYAAAPMKAVQVSTMVNRPAIDIPELIQPV